VGAPFKIPEFESSLAQGKLVVFLEKKGWSMIEAGKHFSCAPAYVSMLRHGTATPGLKLAARIETVTGIQCSEWVSGSVDSAAP
jgi:ribosome-binding protein aMBF1 (putative translation factor)